MIQKAVPPMPTLVSVDTAAPGALLPAKSEYQLMTEMAGALVSTGFLPKAVDTPEKALAIMLKGRELNIPPMQALANIAVINGKPVIQAELMLALIYRQYGKRAIRVKSSTDTACTVEYRLEGWNDVQSYTFTIEQARRAGLVKQGPWTAYPAAMLRARCISAVARMAFPECIAGMYVPGELGEDVRVTEDGEIISGATEPVIDYGEPDKWGPGTGGGPIIDDEPAPEWTEADGVVPEQAPLVDDAAERDRQNARAHAIADGLFGRTGHEVLRIMARHAWGYDSLTECTAEQLAELADRLESKADDEAAFNKWYDKWIDPYLTKENV